MLCFFAAVVVFSHGVISIKYFTLFDLDALLVGFVMRKDVPESACFVVNAVELLQVLVVNNTSAIGTRYRNTYNWQEIALSLPKLYFRSGTVHVV
jgi:hypothetical protein